MLESHELHMQNVVLHGNHGPNLGRLPGCHTSCGLIFWGLFRESSHTKTSPRPRPVSKEVVCEKIYDIRMTVAKKIHEDGEYIL